MIAKWEMGIKTKIFKPDKNPDSQLILENQELFWKKKGKIHS